MGSRGAHTATLCALAALVVAGSAAAAPRPDPPPLPPPAPPPAAPPPVAPPPQAPPPAPVQPPAPAAVQPPAPSPATLAARRARQARIRAQRLRAARSAAAKKAAQRKLVANRTTARSDREAGTAGPSDSTTSAMPLLLAGLVAAAALLALAMTPAWALPRSRAARVLEHRREEVAVVGAMGLFATGLFFFFLTVVAR